MDELKPPTLDDLLKPFLVDELNLISSEGIGYHTYWTRYDKGIPIDEWVCDVYEDKVTVRRSSTFYAADPSFMTKMQNAVRQTWFSLMT